MKIIEAGEIDQVLDFETLIPLIKEKLKQNFSMPQRQLFHLDEDGSTDDAFALLPSWNEDVIGTKAFTYFPNNDQSKGLKSLYSKILLFKRSSGEPLAMIDGSKITYWRTAAISGLASHLLSREQSKRLVLFGSGNLAEYIIKAHMSVRPISDVTIIARSTNKTAKITSVMKSLFPDVEFQVVDTIRKQDVKRSVANADIICCATSSAEPLFDGQWISEGTHIDCLGNHNKERRECDTKTILNSRVYVDSMVNNLAEAGELLVPIKEGVFHQQSIIAELKDMCRSPDVLREDNNQITLFKSVGTAISDLITAHYVYQVLK